MSIRVRYISNEILFIMKICVCSVIASFINMPLNGLQVNVNRSLTTYELKPVTWHTKTTERFTLLGDTLHFYSVRSQRTESDTIKQKAGTIKQKCCKSSLLFIMSCWGCTKLVVCNLKVIKAILKPSFIIFSPKPLSGTTGAVVVALIFRYHTGFSRECSRDKETYKRLLLKRTKQVS